MTLDVMKTTALAALLVTAPLVTYATVSVGDQVGTTDADLRAMLEAAGAEQIEIEVDGDEIEAEYVQDGRSYEIEVSRVTGMVTEAELDDDDEDDDEDDDHDGDDD